MANSVATPSAFQQINNLSKLNFVRQFGLMIVLAGSIALGTAVVLWSQSTNYTVLYSDLSSQDATDILGLLEQNGYDHAYNPSNSSISVSSNDAQQIRLQMATAGLPRASTSGYGMLDESPSLGTSNFIEQARYNRALEQEITQTIKLIRGVRDARVHLSVPRQNSFLRNTRQASASVMLNVVGGLEINDTQIAGILHLVASSVSGLETENVSIVDQKGALMTNQSSNGFTSSNEQLSYTRSLEKEYSERIMEILTPIVGEGNVRAQVSADLDFTLIETTEENYNPLTVVLRSEQVHEENSPRPQSTEPGALSPNPPVAIVDPTLEAVEPLPDTIQTRLDATRNYEVDRTVSVIRSVPGTIERLSVAVLINIPEASTTDAPVEGDTDNLQNDLNLRLQRITQLVQDTIGYNELRGDSVNVINEAFTVAEVFPDPEPLPIWQEAWVLSAAKQVGAGLVVLLLIFVVLKPALKSVVVQPATAALSAQPKEGQLMNSAEGGESAPSDQSKQLPSGSAYDNNLSLAQTLVENEPARAARMIKDWVGNE